MSENQYTKYQYQKLFDLDVEMMRRYGYSEEEAKIIADVLLTSDLFGVESHGCNRMTLYPFGLDIGRVKREVKMADMEVVEDSLCCAVIDAKDGMGQLAGVKGMNLAIEKAKKYGVGMVSVRNSNHFGIAGYYSKLAADAGMMGISMTNAEALVVPTYGKEPMLGTNPIAVTIPAKPHNFHLDFATSIMTCGKMEVYAKIDHELKPGMLVDEQGVTSTDPHKFIEIRANKTNPDYKEKTRGGIMPWGGEGMDFGGHKGFGFGMLVDIMCGIMSHGAVSKGIRVTKKDEKCCHFFSAIDFGRFGDKEETIRLLSEYMQSMRDAEKAQGQDRIYVHGDKEADSAKEVMAHGIGINRATEADIRKYCEKLGINADEYLVPAE